MNTEATTVETNLSTEKVDLDSLFPGATADNVVLPQEEEKKPGFFSNPKPDLSILDTLDGTPGDDNQEDGKKVLEVLDRELNQDPGTDREEPADPSKVNTAPVIDYLKKKIEAQEMFTFDDFDESKQTLDDYLAGLSDSDVQSLLDANIGHIKKDLSEKVPQDFLQTLPPELQIAAKYFYDGGRDLKPIFNLLGQMEEVRSLEIETDEGQEEIARQYLKATDFGDEELINEEIASWKNLGTLKKKAELFKPKLESMKEQMIQNRIQEQEQLRAKQEEAAERYIGAVTDALKDGELNGLKLDKKIQAELYYGLTKPEYQSINGNATNKLAFLLEQHQFVKPNMPLVAEALWLLSDPESYKASLIQKGKNIQTDKTIKELKTEAGRKVTDSHSMKSDTIKLPKVPNSPFKRR